VGGGIRRKVFHNIFDELITLENLFLSWQEFKRGKSKRKDVQEFEFNLEDNIFQLHQELKESKYRHSKYHSFYICDPKLRHIHKAAVKDRVVHHLVSKIFQQIYDRSFIYDSYSCRLGKGTHKAVNRLRKFSLKESQNNKNNFYVLKCDIRKFFDNVDHQILVALLKKRIKDERFLWLIKEIVFSFETLPGKGIPLGNLTSQYFANIYLNELDQFIKHKLRIKYYIRYTDDFVILDENRKKLEELVMPINNFLLRRLKLSLHPEKIIIRKFSQGADFLGYVSFPHFRVLRTKTKRRIFRKILRKIQMLKIGDIAEDSFHQSVQSYFGVLSHANCYKIRKELENKIKICSKH